MTSITEPEERLGGTSVLHVMIFGTIGLFSFLFVRTPGHFEEGALNDSETFVSRAWLVDGAHFYAQPRLLRRRSQGSAVPAHGRMHRHFSVQLVVFRKIQSKTSTVAIPNPPREFKQATWVAGTPYHVKEKLEEKSQTKKWSKVSRQ